VGGELSPRGRLRVGLSPIPDAEPLSFLPLGRKEGNMVANDRELAKKCAFDARTLLNDMQGNGTSTN